MSNADSSGGAQVIALAERRGLSRSDDGSPRSRAQADALYLAAAGIRDGLRVAQLPAEDDIAIYLSRIATQMSMAASLRHPGGEFATMLRLSEKASALPDQRT